MPTIDFAQFGGPLENEAFPAGQNLEYDQRFVALERSAQGKPGAQFGETIMEAVPPDWRVVAKESVALLKETRDFRIACVLLRAGIAMDGLAGLHGGLVMMAEWIEQLWEQVYPQIDPDDGDPSERINALAALCDPDTTLAEVKALPLVQSREHGTILFGELETAFAEAASGAETSTASLRATFSGIGAEAGAALHGLLHATLEATKRCETAFSERLESGGPFDLKLLRQRLAHAISAVERLLPASALMAESGSGAGEGDDDEGAGEGPASEGHGAGVSKKAISGEIVSRADVVKTIDKICEYYTRFEPANPMPIFLARARRMVEMNFLDLLQELVPDSVSQARTVIGLPTE
jgi:type VI secretion system protein ImpA